LEELVVEEDVVVVPPSTEGVLSNNVNGIDHPKEDRHHSHHPPGRIAILVLGIML
jgi:hypothetical protein